MAEKEGLQSLVQSITQGSDLTLRRDSSLAFLEAIQGAPFGEQFDFLLNASGAEVFPKGLSLSPSWHYLNENWEEFPKQLNRVLRNPIGENAVQLNGALSAVAALQWSEPTLVESIAARLNEPSSTTFARAALFSITRHEFSGSGEFHEWWVGARDLGREAWLAEAFDSSHSREIRLWARILKSESSAVFDALQSPVSGVRYLAYEAMAGLPQAVQGESSEVKEILRESFFRIQRHHQEMEFVRLTRLIPHFLLGAEAMQLLDIALEDQSAAVRLEAARALKRVRPAEAALDGVLLHLKRLYVDNKEGNIGTPEFRLALLVGFQEFASVLAQGDADQTITVTLLRALIQEESDLVRGQVYDAIGRLGWPEFLDILKSRSLKEELAREERSAALDALTKIATGMEDRGQALEVLHVLLSHPELNYRAVLGLKKLGDSSSIPILSERLVIEKEDHIRKEILQALGRIPSNTHALSALLAYVPSPDLRDVRLAAISSQIGPGDMEKLRQSVSTLESQFDLLGIVRVLEAFSSDGLGDSELVELESMTVRIHAEWLLKTGLGNGRAARAADTVARLGELTQAQPGVAHWFILLGRLEALRGNAKEALSALEAGLPLLNVGDSEEITLFIAELKKSLRSEPSLEPPVPTPEKSEDGA
jgi:HEAT repeat protein